MQCPVCHGIGGGLEDILDDGTGPWYDCVFCDGKGDIEIPREFYRVLAMLSSEKRKRLKR